jgi:4-diphosphocytidyl-2-C-methyl-D-erythritol kinase
MKRVVRRDAHAKINVSLRVLGRRPDGYHDIDSLVVPVSLADTLTFRFDPVLRLVTEGPFADQVPLDDTNLVVRAAGALAAAAGIYEGADILLHKRIPVAAGLGGGSADAAATLLGLNELWACDLEMESLRGVAARVGSDVPALLADGPVRIRGRGEIVEPATADPAWWILLPLPFEVSVEDAYRWWDEDGGPPASGAAANDLQEPVARRHREVADAVQRLTWSGAVDVHMSGSGPTVVGRAGSEGEARKIAEELPGSIPVSAPP